MRTVVLLVPMLACHTDSPCGGAFQLVNHAADPVLARSADLPMADLFCHDGGPVVIGRVLSTTPVQRDGMTFTQAEVCVERTLSGTTSTTLSTESIGGRTPGGGSVSVGGGIIPDDGDRMLLTLHNNGSSHLAVRDAMHLERRAPLQSEADYQARWAAHCADVDYDDRPPRL